jgi:hypothetical protein
MKPRDRQLEGIAREVVWWETPEVTLADQNEFLGNVMARGVWDAVQRVVDIYGEEAFRDALRHSKPGVIDAASWHYWHHRLGIEPVPELPKRTFD